MKTTTTSTGARASAPDGPSLVDEAYGALTESFEHFCLMAGIESLTQMMKEDVARLAGDRYEHCPDKRGYRWGQTKSQAGFHGGKIDVERPRVREPRRRARKCRCQAGRRSPPAGISTDGP